ncbi:MAG: GGDEF domain-containing protein [Myxococcaceae bacterium]|nr:GGDEF domain-containing protein [Myxococcaceae bacterium]MCA3012997.1 GGDEF domain-containing protein [Myxococcaceae bacterium]
MDTVFCGALVELAVDGAAGLVAHLTAEDVAVPCVVLDEARSVRWLEAGASDVVAPTASIQELSLRVGRCIETAERLKTLTRERDQLRALSTTDGLTQLANHRAFQDRLREEFRRAQRYDDPLTLVLMDVDHFKRVNDTHGHLAGDEVLRQVAEALRSAVRETDFVARYGGEEFGVLLPKTPLAGALTVAERISRLVRGLRVGRDGVIRVTASFGIAGLPGRGLTSPDQLLKAADDALYRSKREGRNKISLFQPTLAVVQGG